MCRAANDQNFPLLEGFLKIAGEGTRVESSNRRNRHLYRITGRLSDSVILSHA